MWFPLQVTLSYELIDEKGPAHLKAFVVKVTIEIAGERHDFIGEGNSIKKAKQAAAEKALQIPGLLHPLPEKSQPRSSSTASATNNSSAVSQLNSLAVRMQSWAEYRDSVVRPAHDPAACHWSTTVTVYGRIFTGCGINKFASRNAAAQDALDYFQLERERKKAKLLETAATPLVTTSPVDGAKAPVSLLYEEARRLRLNVSFASSMADGPAHSQTHRATCSVGALQSEGQGATKKEARQGAAEKMLELVREKFGSATAILGEGGLNGKADKRKNAKAIKTDKVKQTLQTLSTLWTFSALDVPIVEAKKHSSLCNRLPDAFVARALPVWRNEECRVTEVQQNLHNHVRKWQSWTFGVDILRHVAPNEVWMALIRSFFKEMDAIYLWAGGVGRCDCKTGTSEVQNG